jgi:hypothetical protein
MASFATLGLVAGVPAPLVACVALEVLGGHSAGWPQAGWVMGSSVLTFGMVIVGAWWPVRRATGEPAEHAERAERALAGPTGGRLVLAVGVIGCAGAALGAGRLSR